MEYKSPLITQGAIILIFVLINTKLQETNVSFVFLL